MVWIWNFSSTLSRLLHLLVPKWSQLGGISGLSFSCCITASCLAQKVVHSAERTTSGHVFPLLSLQLQFCLAKYEASCCRIKLLGGLLPAAMLLATLWHKSSALLWGVWLLAFTVAHWTVSSVLFHPVPKKWSQLLQQCFLVQNNILGSAVLLLCCFVPFNQISVQLNHWIWILTVNTMPSKSLEINLCVTLFSLEKRWTNHKNSVSSLNKHLFVLGGEDQLISLQICCRMGKILWYM